MHILELAVTSTVRPTRHAGRRQATVLLAASLAATVVVAPGVAGRSPASAPDANPAPVIANGALHVAWREILDPDLADPWSHTITGLADDGTTVLAWGDGIVPVGGGETDRGAVVWLSSDGEQWDRQVVDPGSGPGVTADIRDVVHGPAGWLAVGSVCCDVEGGALWRSIDGYAWDRMDWRADDHEAQGSDIPLAVAASEDGYVVVGQTGGDAAQVGAAWWSRDGMSWTEVHRQGRLGQLLDVVWDGRRFVAVGWQDQRTDNDAVVVTSADGRDWRASSDTSGILASPADDRLWAVTPWARGLYVRGVHGDPVVRLAGGDCDCIFGDDAAYISVDGDSWRRIDTPAIDDELVGPESITVFTGPVTTVGDMLVGVDNALWTSDDGVQWLRSAPASQISHPDSARSALLVRGDEVIAAGDHVSQGPGHEESGAIWVGTLTHGDSPPGP